MARNKHPEETVRRILDVAFRLFMEKGYEHTSIQDMIDELGGLSKGAIYHHFKSKEEILEAVSDSIADEFIRRPVQDKFFMFAPNLYNNPKLLSSILQDTIENVAPNYILPILRQGMEDGSIQTQYPEALAELIVLTANVWINPMVFGSNERETVQRFMVFGQMMEGLGLDILDQEILNRLTELTALYQKNR